MRPRQAGATRGQAQDEQLPAATSHPTADHSHRLHRRHPDRKVNSIAPSPLSTSLFKAFGAAPQSISFGEVYTALQTKLVEAQENPLGLIDSNKFYEVQKFVSMTNHMWDGFWTLANKTFWNRLPQATR